MRRCSPSRCCRAARARLAAPQRPTRRQPSSHSRGRDTCRLSDCLDARLGRGGRGAGGVADRCQLAIVGAHDGDRLFCPCHIPQPRERAFARRLAHVGQQFRAIEARELIRERERRTAVLADRTCLLGKRGTDCLDVRWMELSRRAVGDQLLHRENRRDAFARRGLQTCAEDPPVPHRGAHEVETWRRHT